MTHSPTTLERVRTTRPPEPATLLDHIVVFIVTLTVSAALTFILGAAMLGWL
jgi:hypothetical protein